MTPAPKRRWFRFSLRTLFVVVALVAVALSWFLMEVRGRIHQRREFILAVDSLTPTGVYDVGSRRSPGLLWLFGEQGVGTIYTAQRYEAAATRLFPEAKIQITSGWERTTEEIVRLNERFPGYYVPTPYDH